MAYAVIGDIQARLAGRPTFSSSTKPTDTQITAWITETEAIINGAMKAVGIFSSDFIAGDALEILTSWVSGRVSGLVRMAHAATAGDGDNDDGKDLVEAFDELIDAIQSRPAFYGAMLAGGSAPGASSKVRGYVPDNADGLTVADGDFDAFFTRDGEQF